MFFAIDLSGISVGEMTDKSILLPRGCRSDERKEESGKTAAEPRGNNKGRARSGKKHFCQRRNEKEQDPRSRVPYRKDDEVVSQIPDARGFHFERNATMYTFDDDPNYLGRKTCCIRSGISGPTVLHTVEYHLCIRFDWASLADCVSLNTQTSKRILRSSHAAHAELAFASYIYRVTTYVIPDLL